MRSVLLTLAAIAVVVPGCAATAVIPAEDEWCQGHIDDLPDGLGYDDACRAAIANASDHVWSAGYEAKRLLSDSTWLWCSDNRDTVEEVALSLGLGTAEPTWELVVTPTAFYTACTVAADSRGNRELGEPGMTVIALAREVGYPHLDDQILQTALETCSHFDAFGVTSGSVDVAIHNVVAYLGQIAGTDFTAEVVVGAASAAVCPEYADAVSSFG